MRRLAVVLAGVLAMTLAPSAAMGETVQTEVLRRGHARPDSYRDIGIYVRTRQEYQALWEDFGFRGDRPGVNFNRRRVVFVATHESSSCPLRFQRTRIDFDDRRLVVRLDNGDHEVCTDDWVPRSFVLSLKRTQLPHGDLSVRIRRV